MARTPLVVLGLTALMCAGGALYKRCESSREKKEKQKLENTLKKEEQLKQQVSELEDMLADVQDSGSVIDASSGILDDILAIKKYVDRRNYHTKKSTSRFNIKRSQLVIKGKDANGRQQVFGTGLLITRNGYFVAPQDVVSDLKDGKVTYKGKDYDIETVMMHGDGLAILKASISGRARAIPIRFYRGRLKDDMEVLLYAKAAKRLRDGRHGPLQHLKIKGTIPEPYGTIPYRKKDEDQEDYPEGFPRIDGFKGGVLVTKSGSLYGVAVRQDPDYIVYKPMHKVAEFLHRFIKLYTASK